MHGPGRGQALPLPCGLLVPAPRLSRTVHGLPHGVQAGGVARHGDPAAPGTGTRRARPGPPAPRDGPAQRKRGGGGLSLNSCGGAADDWPVRERGSPAIGPAENTALCDWSQSAEGAGPLKGPPGAAGAGAARRRRPDNGGRWLARILAIPGSSRIPGIASSAAGLGGAASGSAPWHRPGEKCEKGLGGAGSPGAPVPFAAGARAGVPSRRSPRGPGLPPAR